MKSCKCILSDFIDDIDISAAATIWFTNTSYTCEVEQTAYGCQVGARRFNTDLGILDHASNLCTNKKLYSDSCRECSRTQMIVCSDCSNEDDCVNYSDEKCVQMYLDQYIDLTDLSFRPHNYSSQDMNSFKCFSILSSNCMSHFSFSQVFNNTYLGDTYIDRTNSGNNSQVTLDYQHENYFVSDTVNQVVYGGSQCEVIREFGFMPNTISIPPALQVSTDFHYTLNKGIKKIHQAVKAYNVPNYKGARIPVISGLKIDMWRYILKNYDLQIIGDYLQYGFPLNVDRSNFKHNYNVANHASALRNPGGVTKYFNTEIKEQAIVGPMTESPIGQGVNNCVPGDVFDEIAFTLKYPTVDLVVEKIREMGPKSLLFKVDLQRAFRNLRIDPLDYPLLGLKWKENTCIDVALAFGFKNGAAACQLCTDVITHTLRRQKIWLMNYLDDYIGISQPHQANTHFHSLLNLLDQVGLPVNRNKVEAPNSVITCLGIQIDAKKYIYCQYQIRNCKKLNN